jgi:hypothetical protein
MMKKDVLQAHALLYAKLKIDFSFIVVRHQMAICKWKVKFKK